MMPASHLREREGELVIDRMRKGGTTKSFFFFSASIAKLRFEIEELKGRRGAEDGKGEVYRSCCWKKGLGWICGMG